jgi:uncharacterized caspase-like protein
LKSKPDDIVIVSFSGHGILDKDLNFYFATYETDFQNPSSKSLSINSIEDLLSDIPARNRVIFIDACHSGEIEPEEIEKPLTELSINNENLNINEIGFRSNQIVNRKTSLNSSQLFRETFADLSYNQGIHLISAAGGAEYALESEAWNNGVFTYSIIQAFNSFAADLNKDGAISINELRSYVYNSVSILTKGKQNPISRRENLRNDFNLIKQK